MSSEQSKSTQESSVSYHEFVRFVLTVDGSLIYKKRAGIRTVRIMRKIVAALFMTVDGVVETPYKWSQPYVTEDMSRGIDVALKDVDAVLLGRRTYEIFSKI